MLLKKSACVYFFLIRIEGECEEIPYKELSGIRMNSCEKYFIGNYNSGKFEASIVPDEHQENSNDRSKSIVMSSDEYF